MSHQAASPYVVNRPGGEDENQQLVNLGEEDNELAISSLGVGTKQARNTFMKVTSMARGNGQELRRQTFSKGHHQMMARSILAIALVAFNLSPVTSFSFISSSSPIATRRSSFASFPTSSILSRPTSNHKQIFQQPLASQFSSALFNHNIDDRDDEDYEDTEDDLSPPRTSTDVVVAETSLGLKRASWFSWWTQMILTVTSGVILVFAKNVVLGVRDMAQVNFVLAGTGVVTSFLSIFWTWGGGARLSRRLLRKPTSRLQTAAMVRRAIKVGVTLNLAGMLLTLLGAEQTVGVLAIKVLTARPWNSPYGMGGANFESLQPLDILVVQANTNILLSHFASMVSLLYLTRFVEKLDPPSKEDGSYRRKNN